jgi:DNA ligase (NAD+)
MSASLKKKAEELRRQLNHHNYLYYVEATPEISDLEYDRMMKELEALEKEHPELASPDSPTQRVGGQPIEGFTQVKHRVPMLSIDNTYNAADLKEFDGRVRKLLERGEKVRYVVEMKIDGVAMSLTYEKGVLTVGATRGDGETGDDVTTNLKTVGGVPLRLRGDKPPALFEARGEVYMARADFARLNEDNKAKGQKTYANPRNLTAGTLKLLDSKECARRRLRLFSYALGAHEGVTVKTHLEALDLLKKYGFPVNPHIASFETIDEVIAYCDSWAEKRHDLEYDTDGIVIKVNDFDQRERLGMTAKSPRWVTAYKFPEEQAVTRLLDIILTVGKDGMLVPNAVLDPVRLSQTTVSAATLHNAGQLEEKDIRPGDMVVVVKKGEIIPYVVRSLPELRKGGEKPFQFPAKCPVCGSPTRRESVRYYCTRPETCPGAMKRRIESFAKRDSMDIEGLGEEMVAQLVDSGLVKSVTDLYRLTLDQLLTLERVGKKSAQNLLDGIEASKNRGLTRILASLSIYMVGDSMAELLTQEFPTIDALLAASTEQLARVQGFGPTRAESIYTFFHKPDGEKLVKEFRELGVKLSEDVKAKISSGLTGKTVVVTGTLVKYKRDEIERLIKAHGGKAASSVSKKTDLVVVGSEAGSKLAKAKELGVPVISEDDFEKLISTPAPAAATATAATVPPSVFTPPAPTSNVLAGQVFVVTGTMKKYKRDDLEEMIRQNGGTVGGSITKKTKYLVAGEKAGSKMDKAKELGVAVLSEDDFEKMVGKT